MSIFGRKPRIQLEMFCTDFFDNQILSPQVAGIDMGKVFVDSIKKSICDVSPSFETVDEEHLKAEIMLLRFETFSLAFLHTFGPETAHYESRFTKEYLTLRGRDDVWDDLIDYNQMISKSVVYEFDANTSDGKLSRVRVDKMRMDEFSKWLNTGFEGESVARVVNRMGSEKSWEKNITPQLLAWKLSQRLQCEETEGGQFGMSATIYGFYEGARQAMEGVKIDV